MDIPIAPSKMMDTVITEGKLNERKKIRMPDKFRAVVEYDIGEFVYLRTLDGKLITLTVDEAYDADEKIDDMKAYVAGEIHELIMASSMTEADVEPVSGITLGCDPELILVNGKGEIQPASAFLKKYDAVGYDGLLLELRPLPSTCEFSVTNNLYSLLQQMRTKIPNEDIRAIGVSAYHGNARLTPKHMQNVTLTAGFHLHYGLPKELLGYPRRFIADQIVKALDYYVGIPAMIPEGELDSYRRSAPYLEYGKPGTYRLDHRTLEYRVPGGILLRHPAWTAGLIGLGALVIEDIVARIKHHSADFEELASIGNDAAIRALYPNLPPPGEIFSIICSPKIDSARRHLELIWKDVNSMVSYVDRSKSVNNFFQTLGTTYPLDIEHNWWRHYGKRQQKQMDVLSASI